MNTFTEALLHRDGSWGLAILGTVALLAALLYPRKKSQSKFPLPPGPKGYPIIGNIPQVPAERSDIQFAKWSKEHSESFLVSDTLPHSSWHGMRPMNSDTATQDSDIIYLNMLGQSVIVLNSVRSAVDLIDKRGAIYSDRPPFVLLEA